MVLLPFEEEGNRKKMIMNGLFTCLDFEREGCMLYYKGFVCCLKDVYH